MAIRDMLFGRTVNARATDLGLVVLRVFAGLALALAHGWAKVPPAAGFVTRVEGMGMPAPAALAWLAGLAEVAGGLLLAAGLLTRPTSFVLVIHFLVVVFVAHGGDPFGRRELGMFFLTSAVLFLCAGGGRYSLDALMGPHASKRSGRR
jgi:putative oxidoreductase